MHIEKRRKKGTDTMLNEGDAAPPVDLPTGDGGHFSLHEHAGRPVVVYFYPKDDTSGCTREAQDFTGLIADFTAAGATVVGISPDSPKSHSKFAGKYAIPYALAADEAKEVATSYGVWVEKSMYGRKYMGVERTTILVGGDGRIARIWRKVKVPGHADEVLQAVRDLRDRPA